MYWCCNRSIWWASALVETSVVGKVKCCNCINVNMWGDVHRCILWAKYWWFTKRDLLQDNLLHLFGHIRARYNFCMLTLTLNCVWSWMLDFYRGILETVSCELHHTTHRFQNIFFYSVKLQHFGVSISRQSTTMNILSRLYAFLMSVQMYLKCLYKWTFLFLL